MPVRQMMRTLLRDLRYGFRVSLSKPGFTIVAVLTLAIGIAANTTVFSWIDSVLVRPLPGVPDGGELAAFETIAPNGDFFLTSYPDFRDYRDHLTLLDGLAMAQPRPLRIGDDDQGERVWGELVSGNYFAVMGVLPVAGRVFSPAEYGDAQGGYPVAVISAGLWKRKFNSDPGVIGSVVRVNRQPLTIIGVVPPAFRGSLPGLAFEIWIPAMMAPQLKAMPDSMLKDRQTRSFVGIARLRRGVSMERARAEVASMAREIARSEPRTNRGISATLLPMWKGHFGAQADLLEPLRILMAVCILVLLIVCANVGNLLLARSTARQKEFSLRLALGGGQGRLFRQLLTETLMLALAGAIVGAPLAAWMSDWLGQLLPPSPFPMVLHVDMSGDILAFTLMLCILACLASGVAPALAGCRANLSQVLNGCSNRGTPGTASGRLRALLVAAEVALALVALIGAGLFAKSFEIARRIRPGFDPGHVLVSNLYLASAGYSLPERKLFCRRLRERMESQPGVTAATYADMVPLGFDSGPWEPLQIEGYVPGPSESMNIYRDVVAPGYFNLLHIPLLEGRDFSEQDDESAARVMIVNQTFAKRFLGGHNPIGHQVHGWGKWFTVVGVARDSKYQTPNEPARPYFYVPFRQVYREDLSIAFLVRTAGDPRQALPVLRREARELDPDAGVFDIMPMTEFISASLFPQKVAAALLSVLGGIALILAAAGLYSVMAYSVTQRTREIGIRMALGARPGDVVRLVMRQSLAATLAGLAAGFLVALAVTRLASSLLVNISATDPTVFTGATLFLAMVAAVAGYLPARRATRIDPNAALRKL
jgi:putative ABC transport system permease protein